MLGGFSGVKVAGTGAAPSRVTNGTGQRPAEKDPSPKIFSTRLNKLYEGYIRLSTKIPAIKRIVSQLHYCEIYIPLL